MSNEKVILRPYDVLQIKFAGKDKWEDFSTLRDEKDFDLARLFVEGRGPHMIAKSSFRVYRNTPVEEIGVVLEASEATVLSFLPIDVGFDLKRHTDTALQIPEGARFTVRFLGQDGSEQETTGDRAEVVKVLEAAGYRTKTTEAPPAKPISKTRSRLKTSERMSNTGYHENGKPNWWARTAAGGFIDLPRVRGDKELDCTVELPPGTEVFCGAGKGTRKTVRETVTTTEIEEG